MYISVIRLLNKLHLFVNLIKLVNYILIKTYSPNEGKMFSRYNSLGKITITYKYKNSLSVFEPTQRL